MSSFQENKKNQKEKNRNLITRRIRRKEIRTKVTNGVNKSCKNIKLLWEAATEST